MRILFATYEGGGHVPPAIVVARELQERGHAVRFVSDEANRRSVLAAGLDFETWRTAPNRLESARRDDPLDDWRMRWPPRVVRAICDAVICGPAGEYAADTLAQMRGFRPDLVVSNELLFGVMIAAEASATPLALLAPNVWCFPTRDDVPPFGPGFAPARSAAERRRDAAVRRMIARMYEVGRDDLNSARCAHGLAPLASTLQQLRVARRIVLGTSRAFDFGGDRPPREFVYAGPLFERHQEQGVEPPSRAPSGAARPLVLIASSTAYQGQRALIARCIEAVARLRVSAVVTLGPSLSADELPTAENVTVVPYASHAELVARCAAVVCQGGHGIVLRALMAGAPVLCLPGGRDQYDNARRVVERGAGLRLWRYAGTRAIRRAVSALLADAAYRRNASRLGAAIAAECDYGRSAADALEAVVPAVPLAASAVTRDGSRAAEATASEQSRTPLSGESIHDRR